MQKQAILTGRELLLYIILLPLLVWHSEGLLIPCVRYMTTKHISDNECIHIEQMKIVLSISLSVCVFLVVRLQNWQSDNTFISIILKTTSTAWCADSS